ncbi:hypothetical protein EDB87DRAFT_1129714 [Lactarius vividus]|nr:hypothetical protein EDB87DRAFT_1129714 [Lactarius vividus]
MDSNQKSQPSASSNSLSSTSLPITVHRLVDGGSLLGQKTEHPTTLSHGVLNAGLQKSNTSLKVPIEILPVDLGGRPWKWQKLAHVCKTWRSVLLASSHYLDLRLLFTQGMPVREILRSWPDLPIVMQYVRKPGSIPLTPGDQDNIMTLLELPTRLREVRLTVTTPLLENVMMQQPFSVLEYLHLSAPGLVLPSQFGGGMPRLRALLIVGIALPALPRLLLSAHDLVSLQLEDIPSVGYTLEALVICLPAMTQLETLRVHFPPQLPCLF